MTIASDITTNVDKAAEQALSWIDKALEGTLGVIDTVVEQVGEIAPDVDVDAELVGLPGDLTDKGFAFAEQVLGTARLFAKDVFAKVEPLVAASPVVEVVKDDKAA